MSSNIDERIVQMEFNNGQFERGIKQSTKSLEAFQEKLQFKNAEKGIRTLEQATNSFSMESMAQSIANIEARFTNMGIMGQRMLERLADKAFDAGKKMLKSLTIDPIKTGWDKYAELTSAVQTIMNSVDNVTMDEVQGQLELLSWYTDETSYHFSDMVSNIGKFTAAGQSLGTSVKAMIGIANACALAGSNAQKADIAMYNFSQALAAGKVTLLDWKSIGSTAGLDTKEFKTTVIETAKALGKLSKEGKTAKGTLVTYQSFAKTLSEGWFDRDVITASLEKYGEFVEKAFSLVQEGKAKTAAEAIRMITDEEYALGRKAFVAAQEAKTFKEAIEAGQEAVASGWMTTFQLLFGNYEEAKVLWTDLANALYDIFAESGNVRNKLLEEWHTDKVHGYEKALKAVYKILGSLWTIVEAVKEGFRKIFPPTTVESLYAITDKLAEMADYLDDIFWIEDQIVKTFKDRTLFEEPIVEAFDRAMSQGAKGDGVKKLQERLNSLGFESGVADGIWGPKTEQAFREFQKKYGLVVDGVYGEKSHSALIDALNGANKEGLKLFDTHKVTEYSDKLDKIMRISKGVAAVFDIVRKVLGGIGTLAGDIFKGFSPTINNVLTLTAHIGDALADLDKWIDDVGLIQSGIDIVEAWAQPYIDQINSLSAAVLKFFGIGDEADAATSDLTTFWDILQSVKTTLTENGTFDKITESWEKLKASFKSLKETIKGYWESVKKYLSDKFNGAVDTATEWLPKIMTTLGTGLSSALNFVNGIISKIPKGIDTVVNYFSSIYKSVSESETVKKAGENLKKGWATITGAFESSTPKLKGYWTTAKTWLSEKLSKLFENIKGKIPGLIAGAGNLLAKGLSWVGSVIANIPTNLEKIKKFFVDLYEKLKSSEKVQSIIGKVKNIFETVKKTLKNVWDSVIKFIFGDDNKTDIHKVEKKNVFVRIWEAIKTFLFGAQGDDVDEAENKGFLAKVTAAYEKVRAFFESIIPTVKSYYETAKTWLVTKFTSVSSWVQENAPGIIEKIGSALGSAFEWISGAIAKVPGGVGKIKKFFVDLYEKLKSSEKVQSIVEKVKSIANTVRTALGDIWDAVTHSLFGRKNNARKEGSGPKSALYVRLTKAFANIRKFFEKIIPKIKGYYEIAKGWISNKFGTLFKGLKDKAPGILQSIGKGLSVAFSWIINTIAKLPDTVGKVKTFFTDLYEKLKSSERVKKIVNQIKNTVLIARKIVKEIWDAIINFFSPSDDKASGSGRSGRGSHKHGKKKAQNGSKALEGEAEDLEEESSYLSYLWESVKNSAKVAFESICSAIGSIWSGIVSVWNSLGSWKWPVLIIGGFLAIVWLLGTIFKPVSRLIGNLAALKTGTRYNEVNGLTSFADMLKSLSLTIGVIVAAIMLLGNMPEDKFKQGTTAMEWMGGAIAAILLVFTLIGFSKRGKDAMGRAASLFESFLKLAIALGIIAAVVVAFGYIPEDNLKQGLKYAGIMVGGIAALILILSWFTRKPQGARKMQIVTKGLLEVAAAIAVLAFVAYLISESLKVEGASGRIWEAVGVVAALAALVAALILVAGKTAKAKNGKIAIKGLAGVAWAIAILAGIVYLISQSLKEEGASARIWEAVGVVAVLALLVAGIIAVTGKTASALREKGGWKALAALAIIFLGMYALIDVIRKCIIEAKDMDWRTMVALMGGIVLLIAAVGLISLAIGRIKGGAGKTITGALGLGVAFGIIALALTATLAGLGYLNSVIAENSLDGKDLIPYILDGGTVLEALATALKPITDNLKFAALMAIMLIGSVAAGRVGGLATIGGAFGISLSFAIIVSALGALLYGLGLLKEKLESAETGGQSIEDYIRGGGDLLSSVAQAIGGFVGSFIIGFVTKISNAMTMFGNGVKVVREAVEGLGSDEDVINDITAAIGLTERINQYFATLDPYEMTGSKLAGYATAPAQLATDITTFSGAMIVLRAAINGLNNNIDLEKDTTAAIGAAEQLHTFFKDLEPYSDAKLPSSGYFGAPQQLSADIATFGESLLTFRTSIDGISGEATEADTTAAIARAKDVSGFFLEINAQFDILKKNGTSLNLFNSRVNSLLTHIQKFGSTTGTFYKDLSATGVNEKSFQEKTGAAIGIAKAIASFLHDLQDPSNDIERNKGFLLSLFSEDTAGNTVFDSIGKLGKNIGTATKAMETRSIDLTKFGQAIGVSEQLIGILKTVKDNGLTFEHALVLSEIIDDIGTLGSKTEDLNKKVAWLYDEKTDALASPLLAAVSFLDQFVALAERSKALGEDPDAALSNYWEILRSMQNLSDGIVNGTWKFNSNAIHSKITGLSSNQQYSLTSVANAIEKVSNALLGLASVSPESVTGAVSAIQNAIGAGDWTVDTDELAAQIQGSIDSSVIEALGVGLIETIGVGVGTTYAPIANAVNDAIVSVVNSTKDAARNNAKSVGSYFDEGVASGVRNNAGTVTDAVRRMVEGMITTAEIAADEHSPSKEGVRIGKFFDLGIMQGVYDYSDSVSAASRRVITDLIGNAADTVAVITSMINEDMDEQPVIRPVLDLSDITANAQQMNSLFGNRSIGLSGAALASRVQTNANSVPIGSRNNANAMSAIQSVNDRLDNLGEAMTHLKIVMDSGVVAGQIAPKIDKNLGRVIKRKERG